MCRRHVSTIKNTTCRNIQHKMPSAFQAGGGAQIILHVSFTMPHEDNCLVRVLILEHVSFSEKAWDESTISFSLIITELNLFWLYEILISAHAWCEAVYKLHILIFKSWKHRNRFWMFKCVCGVCVCGCIWWGYIASKMSECTTRQIWMQLQYYY